MQQHSGSTCMWSIMSLSWYSGVSGSYHDFLDRLLMLTRKLLDQWFLVFKLRSSLRNSNRRQRKCLLFLNFWTHPQFVVGFLLLKLLVFSLPISTERTITSQIKWLNIKQTTIVAGLNLNSTCSFGRYMFLYW